MAAATEVFKTNPFVGDFNPDTELGRKIFLEKVCGLDETDRFNLTKQNSTNLQQYFQAREDHLGEIVCAIPIEWNANRSVKTTANILTQNFQINLKDVQHAGHDTFATALAPTDPIPDSPFDLRELDPVNDANDKKTFYKRVRSNVVMSIIKNGLSVTGWRDLILEKDKFTYTGTNGAVEYDGGTMLFLIYQHIQPSTIVGLNSLLEEIEKAKLGDFGNDVNKMLKKIESNYKILKINNEAPKKYLKLLLQSLETGPNAKYNEFIGRINDDIESGIGEHKNITPQELIDAARLRYNNMDKKCLWTQVDPHDAQIMARTTKVQKLKKKGSTAPQKPQPTALATQKPDPADCIPGTTVEKWHTVYDGPGPKEVGGKKCWWCPKHELKGKWDGLYVMHTPDKDKGKKSGGTPAQQPADTPANKPAAGPELALQSRLKEVMCTNLCMSEEDVQKIFKAAQSEN